jgi:ech hydrogenase subunit E
VSYTIVLGPLHDAWRGQQRFVVSLANERVTNIEYTNDQQPLVQVERLPRLPVGDALARLTKACPACSHAHALAYSAAFERLSGVAVPERARLLRCAIAELERIIAHLHGVGRLLWALGMLPQSTNIVECTRLAKDALAGLAGTAPLICPGGLEHDLTQSQLDQAGLLLARLNRLLYPLIERLIDHQALLARTVDVGTIPRAAAEQYGLQGPLARASGIGRDVRADQPYEQYAQLPFRTITQENGDVYARLVVLLLEAFESIKLGEAILRDVVAGSWQVALPELPEAGKAHAVVESPYGTIRYSFEVNDRRLAQIAIETPRQFDRLLVRTLLSGALTDDIAVIIASANQCLSCGSIQ